MNSAPIVSFVVPCYKLAHLLPECVNSILSQDYAEFEILIMDNNSPDSTPEVAQSFRDPRVRHIRNESNIGHIRNFNKGISLARGKYVWLLSADDKLRSPHVLSRFVDAMERNPGAGFVFCRSTELHDGKETGIARWADSGDQDRVWNHPDLFVRLIDSNCIVMSSVMMRHTSLEEAGPFQLDLPFATDWHMWCMLALRFDVVYLAEPMVCCRFHEESLTSQYSQEHTRICVADELTVLWRAGQQAGHMGNSVLRGACRAAFVLRCYHLVMAGLESHEPNMTAAEFEEILKDRVESDVGANEIRSAVYVSLTESVNGLLYRGDMCIRNAAELRALWSLICQADQASSEQLRNAGEKVFVHFSRELLATGLRGQAPSVSEAEFEAVFGAPGHRLKDTKDVRATVYTTLADQLYANHEYAHSAHPYWLGLKARPWRPRTWAKLLLLRTGGIGIRLRQMAN
jgi:hypothetical protein